MAIIIRNATQLQNMANDLTADYELGCDIDASETSSWNAGAGFLPVGNYDGDIGFSGSLDGKGYKIYSLVINRGATHGIGLFSIADGAIISNLTLINVDIIGNSNVGSLIGYGRNDTLITNCLVSGDISGLRIVGGMLGLAAYDTNPVIFSKCFSSVNVTATGATSTSSKCGGFVGSMDEDCLATDCFATGTVVATSDFVGGFVGYSFGAYGNNVVYTRCFSSGHVETGQDDGGNSSCGGFAGYIASSLFEDCFATGAVTGTGKYVGGFVGFSQSTGVFTNS